jgi:hypothetical protein
MADDGHWANSVTFYGAMTVVVVVHVGYLIATDAGELLVAASIGLAAYLAYRTVQTAGDD